MSAVVADVLDAAAEYLDKHGWIQNQMADALGGRCAVGALSTVASCRDDSEAAIEAVETYLHLTEYGDALVDWNDEPQRTPAEVIDAFRHTAKVVRDQ